MGRYAKTKGRRFQNYVKSLLESLFEGENLYFKTAIMGESGSDIKIFPEQRFCVEVKHHKKGLVRKDDTPSQEVLEQAQNLLQKEGGRFCLIVLKENYKTPVFYVLFPDGRLVKLQCIEELKEIYRNYLET